MHILYAESPTEDDLSKIGAALLLEYEIIEGESICVAIEGIAVYDDGSRAVTWADNSNTCEVELNSKPVKEAPPEKSA